MIVKCGLGSCPRRRGLGAFLCLYICAYTFVLAGNNPGIWKQPTEIREGADEQGTVVILLSS